MTSDEVEDGIFRVLGRFIKTNNIKNEHIVEAFQKKQLNFDLKKMKGYQCEAVSKSAKFKIRKIKIRYIWNEYFNGLAFNLWAKFKSKTNLKLIKLTINKPIL